MKKLFSLESLSREEGIVYFPIISPITECSIFTRYYHTRDFPHGRLERGDHGDQIRGIEFSI